MIAGFITSEHVLYSPREPSKSSHRKQNVLGRLNLYPLAQISPHYAGFLLLLTIGYISRTTDYF